MMNIFNTSALLKQIGVKPLAHYEPCSNYENGSRDYWKCVVHQGTSTVYHPTSTARMGPNSTVAVVNSKLK